jgi:nucleotide-binding universal stress UspA family protein
MTTSQLPTPPPLAPSTIGAAFSRVLLAIDFGSASLGAARWGTTHVAPEADAVLMHVMPFDDRLSDDPTAISDDESLRRVTPALTGGLGGFGATLNVASSRTVVGAGRPSGCLAAVANDAEASMLVLGRRADANRIHVGEPNVIERAARRTSASVLVVPEGTVNGPDHIVAAVDDSRFAPQVLEVASRLARMHEVPLTVLHVLSPAEGTCERVMRSTPSTAPHLARSTTKWLAELSRAHNVIGRDTTEIAIGDPAREIVRAAMQRESPLVVVGLRGADDSPPGSIGSVARELLTRGPMPVLAINVI